MRYLILIALICLTLQDPCPLASNQRSQLFSDSVKFSLDLPAQNHPQNYEYNYQFIDPFTTLPSIALGLNQWEVAETDIIDVQIINPVIKNSFTLFKLGSVGNNVNGSLAKWKQIKINFFASTRQDIEIGYAEVTQPVYYNGNIFTLNYNLKKQFVSSNNLKVKFFIQTLSVQSIDKQFIGLHHRKSTVNTSLATFQFRSPNNQSKVNYLGISVLIFSTATPGLLYADGNIEQNYLLSQLDLTIPRHGINELRTYIVGLNSFEFSIAQPISLTTQINQKFTLIIGPLNHNQCQLDFISVSYLILSVVDCGYCQDYAYFYQGQCLKLCPPGTVRRNSLCVPIDCVNGYVRDQELGYCVPECGSNQKFYEGRCQCLPDFYLISGRCQKCPPSTYYNYKTFRCQPFCGANAVYRDNQCYCKQGYYIINGSCQSCPAGFIFSSHYRDCVPICHKTQIMENKVCVCPQGHFWVNSTIGCRANCGQNELWNPSLCRCDCHNNYYRINGICTLCPPGSYYNATFNRCVNFCKANQQFLNGYCQCLPNYYRIDGTCQQCPSSTHYNSTYQRCIPICGTNEYLAINNYTCLCIANHYRVNGQCIKCPVGTRYNQTICRCVDICDENQIFSNGLCICASGFHRVGQKCIICPPGTVYNDTFNRCVQLCRQNQQYDFHLNKCVCLQGFFLIDGLCGKCPTGYQYIANVSSCVPICSFNQYYSFTQHKCKCIEGTYRINDTCHKCPPNTYYDNQYKYCVLICAVNQYYNHVEKKCLCKEGYYLHLNTCVACPPGSYFNTTYKRCFPYCSENQVYLNNKCVCKEGFYRVQGICTQCPQGTYYNALTQSCQKYCQENQQYINGVCQCIAGFYKINGCCTRCDYPSVYWGGRCISCPANSHHSQGTCVCSEGFYMINGVCTQCGPNQIFNGFKCICIDGYTWDSARQQCIKNYIPTCPNNQYWDGNVCKCKPGMTWIHGMCLPYQECYENAFWNGYKCICKTGFVYDEQLRKCVKQVNVPICPENSTYNGIFCCCNPGFYPIREKTCSQCPPNQYWNGFNCTLAKTCEANYYWDEKTICCKPLISKCSLHEYWNGYECVCENPYNLINGVCQLCPFNTFFDGQGCVFGQEKCQKSNQLWNGFECICREGFYMINGGCVTCPSWAVWNGARCVAKNSFGCQEGEIFFNDSCIKAAY